MCVECGNERKRGNKWRAQNRMVIEDDSLSSGDCIGKI